MCKLPTFLNIKSPNSVYNYKEIVVGLVIQGRYRRSELIRIIT